MFWNCFKFFWTVSNFRVDSESAIYDQITGWDPFISTIFGIISYQYSDWASQSTSIPHKYHHIYDQTVTFSYILQLTHFHTDVCDVYAM